MESLADALESLTISQTPIYLLKTKSSPTDDYESQLATSLNLTPIFVPVLEHRFRDESLRTLKLHTDRFAFAGGSPATARQKACNNPAKKYGGIIFTSQRAVDAFALVVERLNPERRLFDPGMPIYVVGAATAKGVTALGLPCEVVGEETGNGEALAEFILKHHAALDREVTCLAGKKLPLLFLVGEQRRDIIPKTLMSEELPEAERIVVQEVVVYETGEMAEFEEMFTAVLKAARTRVKEQWVVVFSPQGCEAMLSALGWLDEKTGNFSAERREIMSGPVKTRVATIGPTTRSHLVEQFDFEPDVCAPKPSPEGLIEGIRAAKS